MTECRKVQELTKEFLEKLSKVKAFKESIISLKTNNNFESRRIRTKNLNNNITDESQMYPYILFTRSGNIQANNKIPKPKKIPPLSRTNMLQNENSKEKDNNIKIFKKNKKKPKILPKPKHQKN